MSPKQKQAYIEGSRAAWRAVLLTALKHLGYESPEMKIAGWITEREAAMVALRSLCEEHGDNDWENDLHLAGIIDNHLGRYLEGEG